ncbi:C13 family peptidase [Falsiroseomonas oryzae]|uniref:C13 family peptidase n=1 Tax=Falsiroseomonas oryzae TaxID=2766473 RepID=UPI0022EA6A94|nr:C13 family peptidase [Roseomonas sp. MO-31]
MRSMTRGAGLLAIVALLAGCAAPPPHAGPIHAPDRLAELRWRAVLVAGDPSLPVWDNAASRLASGLASTGAAVPGQVTRLTARRDQLAAGARPGGKQAALAGIAQLRPGPGEGCLVFLTMHGTRDRGLLFQPGEQHLSPDELDAALAQGCGDAPTVVVASGCYTGSFATGRMARPNRVVMTAARADRSSFGCGVGFELTVFDDCLLRALGPGGVVPSIWAATTACVRAEEARRAVSPPSSPVLHEGTAVRGLRLPAFGGKAA